MSFFSAYLKPLYDKFRILLEENFTYIDMISIKIVHFKFQSLWGKKKEEEKKEQEEEKNILALAAVTISQTWC